MNKDLDCCTHYNRQGYYTGYVMLPVFRVRICRNCGEVHAEWSRVAKCIFWDVGQTMNCKKDH